MRDQSRSGREMGLVAKLTFCGFTFGQIYSVHRKSRIGKWTDATDAYR